MSKWRRCSDISSVVINTEKLYEAFIHLAYQIYPCAQNQRKNVTNIFIYSKAYIFSLFTIWL